MPDSDKINEGSSAVQSHLEIEQSVIERMAGNSTACKTWCITLVSAILVVVADKNKPSLAFLAIVPTVLFCILDAYYLGLERMFRKSYKEFVIKLHRNEVVASDLFVITPQGTRIKEFFCAIFSCSVWLFYGGMLATILLVRWLAL